MNIQKLTIAQIKSGCIEKSFERGEKYYTQGNVISAKISNSTITAHVLGTQEYQVKISHRFGNIDYYCTCPYDFGGFCKHIVAVLLHAYDHFDVMIQNHIQQKEKRDDAFFGISGNQLKEFLKIEMEYDEDLEIRFIDYFGKDDNPPIRDYKSEITLLYRKAAGQYNMIEYRYKINFEKFIRASKTKEAKGDYPEVTRIYPCESFLYISYFFEHQGIAFARDCFQSKDADMYPYEALSSMLSSSFH